MATVVVRQVKSQIRRPKRQKLTLEALGLGRINKSVEVELTPQIEGMVKSVGHLVEVTEK